MIGEKDLVRNGLADIWHQKTLFLVVFVLFTAAFLFVIWHIAPVYRATALVDVSLGPGLPNVEARGSRENASDPILIQTEVDVLNSDQIARLVIQQLHLGKNPTFVGVRNEPEPSLDALVQTYRSFVSVQNDNRSTLASVIATSTDPELASTIANTQATVYLKLRLDRKLDSTDVSSSKLISPAEPPSRPYYSRKPILSLISLSVSALLSALVVLAVDGSLALSSDMNAVADANGLVGIASAPLPTRRRSPSAENIFRDRMRAVRDAVLRAVNGESTVIVVVSSLPEEGKSQVCLALAESLSMHSRRTLLVDADVRKPSLLTLTNWTEFSSAQPEIGPGGVESVLEGAAIEQEVVYGPSNIDLLPAVQNSAPQVDLLAGEPMARLIDQARAHYQFVILDTPPLAVASEGAALASIADQTLFVTRGTGASYRRIGESLSRLRAVRANVLGLIHTGKLRSDVEVGRNRRARAYYTE